MSKTTYYGVTPEARERIKNEMEGKKTNHECVECDQMKTAREKAKKVTREIEAEKAAKLNDEINS
jgi:ribosomal protein L37AE/L43A